MRKQKRHGIDELTQELVGDLWKDAARVRLRAFADSVKLKLVSQPENHPCYGKLWSESYYRPRPDNSLSDAYSFSDSGWTEIGEYIGPMLVPRLDADGSDFLRACCGIYLVATGEVWSKKFRTLADECGGLAAWISGDTESKNRVLLWCKRLFHPRIDKLHWERNQQPEHPEAASLVAELSEVFDLTVADLGEMLDVIECGNDTSMSAKDAIRAAERRTIVAVATGGVGSKKGDKLRAAMALLNLHPDWTDARIADEVDCTPSNLSKNPNWRLARATFRRAGKSPVKKVHDARTGESHLTTG